MSNSLAVAAATTGLRWILERSLTGAEPGAVSGATVTTLRPQALAKLLTGDDPPAGLNVFCYRITPNHSGALNDLPTRRPDGSLAARPAAALDLHYLITGYGQDAALDDQRLLARAVLGLAVTPSLTRPVIEAALAAYRDQDGLDFLDHVDLAEQPDLVKFAPASLTLEELSKVWGIFGTAYLPSLTYTATMVVLEAQVSARTALPVRARYVGVGPLAPPRLVAVDPEDATVPLCVGSRLLLTGSGLRGEAAGARTLVELGAAEVVPASVAPDRVVVEVPDGVGVGAQLVRVLHRKPPGAGGAPSRVVARSAALPVLVRPRVSIDPDGPGGVLRLRVVPAIRPGQPATVSLNRLSGGSSGAPAWLSYDVPPAAPGTPPRDVVELPAGAVGAGRWLIRIEVAGAESVPSLVGETYGAPAVSR
ncbi:DUF4255 domain-containing protein [Actinopolymorpha rutila]|uniref:Pvc16 N-terminal domain-containing protein n=1 Tax=Actinopolymorpha rutila TaxID=446787 RepID=A0A852ZP36_9ACTN|nr:DUF4255 domain-containing protein [Actinopolymorpha rutila]NYH90830.1 hypothetical protein [Actinopolymorpha rutila]